MDDFVAATALERESDTVWRTSLRQDWALWGPAGGYLAALAMRAAGEATELTRPLSLSCQFLRLARFEPVRIEVKSLRHGKRSEALQVTLIQHDAPVLTAAVWAGRDDSEGMVHDYAACDSFPAPASLPTYQELYPQRGMHPFMARMEQRPINPVADGDFTPRAPQLESLFRFQPRATADDPFVDCARALLLLDTYSWLATYPAHPSAGPSPWIAPTLDFYYRFHRPTAAHEWLYMKTRADLADHGLVAAHGEIRDLQGLLLASGSTQMLCSRRPEQFR